MTWLAAWVVAFVAVAVVYSLAGMAAECWIGRRRERAEIDPRHECCMRALAHLRDEHR